MPQKLDMSNSFRNIISSETKSASPRRKRNKGLSLEQLESANPIEQGIVTYLRNTAINDYLKCTMLQGENGSNPFGNFQNTYAGRGDLQLNTANFGLSRDMGMVNYYPTSDLYSDFISQLDDIYQVEEVSFEQLMTPETSSIIGHSNFINDLFQSQSIRGTMPLTEERCIESVRDFGTTQMIQDIDLLSVYQEQLVTEPLEINIGILDDMVYTTTNTINVSFIDGIYSQSKMHVPCTGVLFDIISDMLLVEPIGYDMQGHLLSNINAFVHYSKSDRGLSLISPVIDRQPVQYVTHNKQVYKSQTYKVKLPTGLFPLAHILHSNTLIDSMFILNVSCLTKVTSYEDIKLSDKTIKQLIHSQDFLPLGSIQPLMKLYKMEGGYFAHPLTFTKNNLYPLYYTREKVDEDRFVSKSLLSKIVSHFRPNLPTVTQPDASGSPALYSQMYFDIISSLRNFMGNEEIDMSQIIYGEINNFNQSAQHTEQNTEHTHTLFNESDSKLMNSNLLYQCPNHLVTDIPFEI